MSQKALNNINPICVEKEMSVSFTLKLDGEETVWSALFAHWHFWQKTKKRFLKLSQPTRNTPW